MIHLREQYYAMQVDDANNAVVIGGAITWRTPSAAGRGFIPLPTGTWQIVCMSKEATEELAAGIVDNSQWYFPVKHTRYIDYAFPFDREFKQRWSEGFGKATESLRSLLTSKGCDTKQNWLILKKQ